MTPILALLAGLVVAGAVAAIAAATPRLAVLGLLVAITGAAYVADPLPGPLGLGARLAGSTLGVFLIWIALRRAPLTVPAASSGWTGTAAIAIVAFLAGWLAAGTLGAALGGGSSEGPGIGGVGVALVAGSPVPRAALGAAMALVAVSLPQVLLARDTLRLGIACLLLLAASGLVANALAVQSDSVTELALSLLTAAAGAGSAVVIAGSMRRGGDLLIRDTLRPDTAVRHRPADDAHPRLDR